MSFRVVRLKALAGTWLFGIALLIAACGGEDRPEVSVINDGSGSGSASGSASGSVSGALPPSTSVAGGAGYNPVSNVDIYFNMGSDVRDIRAIMAPATEGRSVDWPAAIAIYENGKNQARPDGTLRSMASIPNDAVQAVFPNGASVYGRPNFVDAILRDGLNGAGRGQGLSDDARRQIVDKGLQMILYGKALQELEAAKTRVQQGNTDNATGAPHAVDEAWAAIAGTPDPNGTLAYGLLATASGREGNFGLAGKLRQPLEAAFVSALAASQKGDTAAFDAAYGEIKGYLNAIFYLGTLRYAKVLEGDTTEAQRQTHLAEGWAFFQAIRAAVASASPSAAQTVESAYTRSPSQPFPASATEQVYAALNEPAVLQALGIPAALAVRTPPSP